MATENIRIQFLRGTAAENNLYTGRDGELTIDSDSKMIRVHDGATQGGHPIGYAKDELLTTNDAIDLGVL